MKIGLRESLYLSLKEKGCNAYCCRHGSPYVLPEEAKAIREASGKDPFTKIGNYYIIGKKSNGGKRNLKKDPCPYLTKKNLCSLQIKSPALKPRDCYMRSEEHT